MTIRSAQESLVSTLRALYDDREAANIADWVMEHVTGKKRIDRIIIKEQLLTANETEAIQRIQKELSGNRPVQYVLGEAWFAGMKFYVNENVLIPRPETEELVEWILLELKNEKVKSKNLIDIGSGSGCIPVTLKKRAEHLEVNAIDVSEPALTVAKKNAASLDTAIHFLQLDFLEEKNWETLPAYDIIVSNPPYIKVSEKKDMSRNVLDFEPSIALFVPDEDPLLFYRKIAAFAKTHLTKNGTIFLEINEALGKEITELYQSNGYAVEIRKDMQEKDRMVKISGDIIRN